MDELEKLKTALVGVLPKAKIVAPAGKRYETDNYVRYTAEYTDDEYDEAPRAQAVTMECQCVGKMAWPQTTAKKLVDEMPAKLEDGSTLAIFAAYRRTDEPEEGRRSSTAVFEGVVIG